MAATLDERERGDGMVHEKVRLNLHFHQHRDR